MLRRPPLAALAAAEVISATGTQMTALALPWFVLTTTDSPSKRALVMAAEVLPWAPWHPGRHRGGVGGAETHAGHLQPVLVADQPQPVLLPQLEHV